MTAELWFFSACDSRVMPGSLHMEAKFVPLCRYTLLFSLVVSLRRRTPA